MELDVFVFDRVTDSVSVWLPEPWSWNPKLVSALAMIAPASALTPAVNVTVAVSVVVEVNVRETLAPGASDATTSLCVHVTSFDVTDVVSFVTPFVVDPHTGSAAATCGARIVAAGKSADVARTPAATR